MPLGGVDLVAAEGEQIRPQFFHGEGQLAKPLNSVHMEQGRGLVPADGPGGRLHRENGTGFVVHQHHAHQDGAAVNGVRQSLF